MKKSKRNLARRQQELEDRLDRRWQPEREQPVLESGGVQYEVSGRCEAIGCGGLGMLQALVQRVGLSSAINEKVSVFKRHLPYHESDHVLSLAYNVLTGGRCLEDLEARRQDLGYLKALGARRIPDPTTAGDFLRRFDTERVEALMGAVNQSRMQVWRSQPSSHRRMATIDVDGTIAETRGRCKERMHVSYDGRWGFGPLVVSLANSQEVLYVVNRPANRPSHEGAPAWLDKAVVWAREAGFERVRLRGDTDFSLTANFDRWTNESVEFVFGMDANPSFVERAEALEAGAWKPLRRRRKKKRSRTRRRSRVVKDAVVREKGYRSLELEAEHVTEVEYRPSKCRQTYRLIMLRKRIQVTEGQLRLSDDIRYFFYVTNIPRRRLGTAGVVRESNARCDQENLIEQLKNGVQATRLPVREFAANWAYLVIASLAWNLKAWAGMLLPAELGARALVRMEFRRFLNDVILQPAQIFTTGRRHIFRLLAVNHFTCLLLEGTRHLQRWRYA